MVRATAGEPGRQESTHLRCARECPYSARAGKTGRRACSRGNARYVSRLHQAPPADRSQSRARQAAGSCAAPVERPYTGAWRRHVNVAIGRHVRARGDRVRLRALLRASGALARRVPSNIPRRHRPRVAGRAARAGRLPSARMPVHAGRRGECARYGYPHWYARFCVATCPSVNLTCCHGQRNTRRRTAALMTPVERQNKRQARTRGIAPAIPVYFGYRRARELGCWSTGACHRMRNSGSGASRI